MAHSIILQRKKQGFLILECKETGNMNSVQSSLKSHLFWVTLYLRILKLV